MGNVGLALNTKKSPYRPLFNSIALRGNRLVSRYAVVQAMVDVDTRGTPKKLLSSWFPVGSSLMNGI
jgi:hypothetical protein